MQQDIIKFTKMHGLGNDFMVIDATKKPFSVSLEQIAQWADRHTGVGFDQLLVVEPSQLPECEFRYRIFNADGSEVEQCGNGARCFARFVQEHGLTSNKIIPVQTAKGKIILKIQEDNLICVDMGEPKFLDSQIPFIPSDEPNVLVHTLKMMDIDVKFCCVNMGNPHAVLLVEDIQTAQVTEIGKEIESHPQFPERVNVGFMQVLNRTHVALRVFERGVGETQACGSGACAAAVVGIRLGLLDQHVCVSQAGGDLHIQWQAGQNVHMTGPAVTVYQGSLKII